MIRTLTFTTLFPNGVQPIHGVFVATRLAHLLATGKVETRVVAPVPWFPSRQPRFGTYARLASIPAREERAGVPIHHPRYPVIPKVGMSLAPLLLYWGARPTVASLLRQGFDFDVIDAHYFYPDGVAAVMLGKHFGKPVVITARGTDVNHIPEYAIPRRWIRWAAREAAGLVAVAQALKDFLVALDVPSARIRVLRNGVDLDAFRPGDRVALRRKHGLEGPVVLSAGHLIPRKGHDIAIAALSLLPGVSLVIAGDGPERAALERQARDLGLASRVRFLGQILPAALAEIYAAADILVLASSHEGWPNVLLEAMACGTPVVASRVDGSPEVVTEAAAGLLVDERSGPAFAAAIARLFAAPPEREATRAYAERFSWEATTEGQLALFAQIVAATANGAGAAKIAEQVSSATANARSRAP